MPRKILVAVHGMGDQIRCATIQMVANRVCEYFGLEPSMPLGRFNAELVAVPGAEPSRYRGEWSPAAGGGYTGELKEVRASAAGAFLIQSPPDPELHPGIGFGEVYWAGIPRGPAKELYTLEEAKAWGKTTVARVKMLERHRRQQGLADTPDTDYELVGNVIQEVIDAVGVLEQLLFLMEKMTPLRFNLKRILVDYLGDVQLVAEFENYRKEIVGLFQNVMAKIFEPYQATPDDLEIYVFAHSEGTVVAFLGLLDAYRCWATGKPSQFNSTAAAPRLDWIKRVRGFMTFGSPINKHLCVWPELWNDLSLPPFLPPLHQIPWRNYYDYGDPIGFSLDHTREWLDANSWQGVFDFDPKQGHDMGFARSCLAGAAHNDYWNDNDVFGHFLGTVVKPPPRPAPAGMPAPPPPRDYSTPRNRWYAVSLGPTLPYLIPFGLLLLGVYLFHHAVVTFLDIQDGLIDNLRNVAGITLLLAGLTAAVRIPHVTRNAGWRLFSISCFLAAAALFPFVTGESFQNRMGGSINLALRLTAKHPPDNVAFQPALWPMLCFLLVSTAITAAAAVACSLLPIRNVSGAAPAAQGPRIDMGRILIAAGAALAVVLIGFAIGWLEWSWASIFTLTRADDKELYSRAGLRSLLAFLGVVGFGGVIAQAIDHWLPTDRARRWTIPAAAVLFSLGGFSNDWLDQSPPFWLCLAVFAVGLCAVPLDRRLPPGETRWAVVVGGLVLGVLVFFLPGFLHWLGWTSSADWPELVFLACVILGGALTWLLYLCLPDRCLKRFVSAAPALLLLALAVSGIIVHDPVQVAPDSPTWMFPPTILPGGWFSYDPVLLFLTWATVGGWAAYLLSGLCPASWGSKPLIIAGACCLFLFVFVRFGWGPVNYYHTYYQNAKKFLAEKTQFQGKDLEHKASELFRRYSDDPSNRIQVAKSGKTELRRGIKDVADDWVKNKRLEPNSDPRWLTAPWNRDDSRPVAPSQQDTAAQEQPVWPVILLGAVFLYLWWLGAMCFDLLVIWQHYIRSSALQRRLQERTPPIAGAA